jgi:hypothetical protein
MACKYFLSVSFCSYNPEYHQRPLAVRLVKDPSYGRQYLDIIDPKLYMDLLVM